MRGQILVFNELKEAGAIVATDGQRFLFHARDWQDVVAPEGGMSVEFKLNDNNRAQQVQLALPQRANALAVQTTTPLAQRPKSKAVLTLLTLFLGFFGAHRFYMGAWGWGLVQSAGMLLLMAILALLLPPLAGLLYLALMVLTLVEAIRYIWSSDAAFDAKVKTYQAGQPGPFGFFW